MMRWLARFLLVALLVALAAIMFISPYQSWKTEQAVTDQFIRMGPDAALQAGFVRTMHEQRWGSHAFVHVLGLTLPRGYTEAKVRAPIKVFYGVRPKHLHVVSVEDGIVKVAIDKIDVLNVETEAQGLEVETQVGWARLDSISGDEARAAARKGFDLTKFRAADGLLDGKDVQAHVRMAILKFIGGVEGIRDVVVVRSDELKVAEAAAK